jgi:hypothetical protein
MFCHNGRMAGQMLAEMAADKTGIGIVRAAAPRPDVEYHVLAAKSCAAAGDASAAVNA